MSKKHHGGPAPVPPANRPQSGPPSPTGEDEKQQPGTDETGGVGFQEQDPKRRLGDYGGAGEHSIQQPGPLNDGGKQSR
jgi:hypothetical protein